jgi:hypothetical protein
MAIAFSFSFAEKEKQLLEAPLNQTSLPVYMVLSSRPHRPLVLSPWLFLSACAPLITTYEWLYSLRQFVYMKGVSFFLIQNSFLIDKLQKLAVQTWLIFLSYQLWMAWIPISCRGGSLQIPKIGHCALTKFMHIEAWGLNLRSGRKSLSFTGSPLPLVRIFF